MAYTTINKSTDYFNTKLYTGNSSTNNITGVGFQPDWVWMKNRGASDSHYLYDAVRGVTKNIYSNLTNAEGTASNGLTAFGTDGFTLGNEGDINGNGNNYVAWNWKANGSGSSNTDGSITSTVSAGITQGMSIVSYTGTGSASTVGHGLGSVPKMLIVKERDNANDWKVYHHSIGNNKTLRLDTTDAETSDTTTFASTTPTSSVFSVNSNATNRSGGGIIAYCFADVQGFSKVGGSYTGNGSSDGTFVYTGFKPAFFMAKKTSAAGDPWVLIDNKRNTFNALSNTLTPNNSNAEDTGTDRADFLSQGVKIRTTSGAWNASGATYIFIAFAEAPLVGSNNVPCTAR